MTTSSLIQARIDKGNSIAARQVGTPFSLYRPTSPLNPLQTVLATLPAWFTQDTTGTKLPKTKSSEFYGFFDGSRTQVGDYLTNGQRTFFVAAQQPLLPYLVINCDRVISVLSAASTTAVGFTGYSGATATNGVPLLTGWPAACRAGTKGEKSDTSLPDDVRTPWWVFQLPHAGVQIDTDYIITDDLGRRYSVSNAELSEYGWKLTARQDVT